MTSTVTVATLAICGSMGAIVVGATLAGVLLYWIESRIDRSEH